VVHGPQSTVHSPAFKFENSSGMAGSSLDRELSTVDWYNSSGMAGSSVDRGLSTVDWYRHQIISDMADSTDKKDIVTQVADGGIRTYDVAIIGGGVAGLSLSILLAKAGYKVVLFEKEKYPFHKVCGEYISLESWNFIERLGLSLHNMNLPLIKKLIVTSPVGKKIESDLDLGGFGISRYLLDTELCKIAKQSGVEVFEQTKVIDVVFEHDLFTISTSAFNATARIAAGCFGKRSNIDLKWMRAFVTKKPNKLNNYIGVKYHIQSSFTPETIALHNFENGYCGISKIEEDKYCLCYLTTARNLSANNNSISGMEKNVLQKNPFLKKLFSESVFLYQSPLTISQISFNKKSPVENHVLMTGDAAGMITPLCGNGMSMAFHAGKIAFGCIDDYLKKKISRGRMEKQYGHRWNKQFKKRVRNGRIIQIFFGKAWLTNMFVTIIKHLPFVTRYLIKSTHGKPF
jgi:menaquinone-9 beta-reductase